MTQKNIWNISVKELMEKYQVTKQGLTTARAEELRLEKGENILQESRRKSIPEVFISQFADREFSNFFQFSAFNFFLYIIAQVFYFSYKNIISFF